MAAYSESAEGGERYLLFVLVFLGSEILNWSPRSTFGFIKVVSELSIRVTRASLLDLYVFVIEQVLVPAGLQLTSGVDPENKTSYPHIVTKTDAVEAFSASPPT